MRYWSWIWRRIITALFLVALFKASPSAALECLDCHKGAIGNRLDIKGQMSSNSHHIQGVEVTGRHCYACHWEAGPDGRIDPRYHKGDDTETTKMKKDAKVHLVIWGAGERPTVYRLHTTAVTFMASAIGTSSEREEAAKVTSHCMSCHSDQNNETAPFAGDGHTPRRYAWDRQSIASRYAQKGITTWGKYSTLNGSGKRRVIKAFSAHGNAAENKGGWSTATGYDADIPVTRGGSTAKNVECFDCHNSHGSRVGGITSSYRTSNGTLNGGILKETQAGKGGYPMGYQPTVNSDTTSKNPYNAGAGLCFDCHETATAGATPWGYKSTYGASEPIMGYKDTMRFGPGTKGSTARYVNRQGHKSIASSHLKAGKFLNYTAQGEINGLCTPCHDPHGVSPTLGERMSYSVPLLKGSWMTSPYREDAPPLLPKSGYSGRDSRSNEVKKDPVKNNQDAPTMNYSIDRNTFGGNTRITENDDKFAGLCLTCHRKRNFSSRTRTEWMHLAVKGWGANKEHSFPCSKCHQPHNSGLPRLMQTNCLNAGPAGLRKSSEIPWSTAGQTAGSPGNQGGQQLDKLDDSKSGDVKTVKESVVGCHVKRSSKGKTASNPTVKSSNDSRWKEVKPW